MKRYTFSISFVTLGLYAFTVTAAAQTAPITEDFFKINYFSNNGVAGAPDATVRIDNPGSPIAEVGDAVTADDGIGSGDINLCAMIYVFDNDQQLSECCGCLVTPDGLRTLSVTHNLSSNPLTGTVSNNGVIKIVSTPPDDDPCNPAILYKPTPTIRAWASHIENKVGTAYPITETPFTDATLGEAELVGNLIEQCEFAVKLGSGQGICSCGTGD